MRTRTPDADGLLREGVLVLGGLRALLLQLAHPAIGHGVAEHSTFASDPVGRLHATLTYVYLVQAGDPALLGSVTRRINGLHERVRSAPDERPAYDANDADLQYWVAATIHDTSIRMAELVWGPLPEPLRDELLARNAALGTSLGMPGERWPADSRAFDADFARRLAALRFDSTTEGVVRELLRPSAAARWVRLAMPVLARFTAPLLPDPLPAPFGLTGRGRVVVGTVRALAPVYRALPERIRTLPRERYLRRVRADADRRSPRPPQAPPRAAAVGAEK